MFVSLWACFETQQMYIQHIATKYFSTHILFLHCDADDIRSKEWFLQKYLFVYTKRWNQVKIARNVSQKNTNEDLAVSSNLLPRWRF